MIMIASNVWGRGSKGVFITLGSCFDIMMQIKIKIYRMIENFMGYQNILIIV